MIIYHRHFERFNLSERSTEISNLCRVKICSISIRGKLSTGLLINEPSKAESDYFSIIHLINCFLFRIFVEKLNTPTSIDLGLTPHPFQACIPGYEHIIGILRIKTLRHLKVQY